MSDFAQTVKQQADIVKVIEGYIRLRKAGAQNYQGLCPFHKEKSPSFSVHAVRQFYHCFGCQASGDVFSFVAKIENVTFPEAVRIVAGKCGIPLPKREFSSPEEAAGARMRAKLLELHETATAWFEEQLRGPEGAVAREYLAGRGLTPEGIKAFRIGYSPDSFNALRDRLSPMADNETLRASGLFASKEQGDGSLGPIYDRFRKRVMFPIANESGRVIAFTARTLETGEKAGANTSTRPRRRSIPKASSSSISTRPASRFASMSLPARRRPDGLHLGLSARHPERDRDQRHGFYRAAGEPAQAPHLAGGRQFRSRRRRLRCRRNPSPCSPKRASPSNLSPSTAASTPDRYIREQIRQLFAALPARAAPSSSALACWASGASAKQKVKAMNYLLPHIRRLPEKLARDQFSADAAQKLGIELSA